MPEDSKQNPSKKSAKHEPKDQRKPRQSRPKMAPPAVPEKKNVKKDNMPENITTQEPGPEFYKSLKRETDEILKITEESNAKYNSKEIQSNWKKYEIPIESYEEIEEQENVGADYEKLIQAPMSIGGHFQFKHEKSWDSATGPSEYDKYFDIFSDNLSPAICTIPFYERNDLNPSMFSEIDLSGMRNRAIKYKQKYYNDKTYTTPDLEVMLSNATSEPTDDNLSNKLEINLTGILSKDNKEIFIEKGVQEFKFNSVEDTNILTSSKGTDRKKSESDEMDDILEVTKEIPKEELTNVTQVEGSPVINKAPQPVSVEETKSNVAADPVEAKKPLIESPEDLEKWLDDFLDT